VSGTSAALLGFAGLLALIAARAPIALAMLLVGAIGYAGLASPAALFAYMKTNAYHQFSNYTLSVIPLFILMGAIAERSGMAAALFSAAGRCFGARRGGQALAVIGACTAFGAICGSSVATTATFGRAALPSLRRAGYDEGFACATIAAGGTLGILIPPSIILVIYALTTEQNIAKLFQAALVPGLLAALLYGLAVTLHLRRNPHLAPARDAQDAGAVSFRAAFPALLVAVLVVGGIYGGLFTPTEGAAVGVIAMLGLAFATRSLDGRGLIEALKASAVSTGMILFILLGAEVFGAFLALTRLPSDAAAWIGGLALPPMLVLLAMLAFYIALGAVMDELAMILITLPVFFPIVQALDFGLPPDEVAIWFGMLVLIVVGIGLMAPPIGLNVFVIAGLVRESGGAGVAIGAIYRHVLPYLVADLARLALVLAFPALALGLVRLLA
jgi:C4-dicarboxylate transporter, DctM subunit